MRYRRHVSVEQRGITSISVEGFKSIAGQQSIDIRPLTVLAGVNSSGKSSMLQPLLLLKQTLHSDFDPGPLLLDGPNVKFTRAEQFLSRVDGTPGAFGVGVEADGRHAVQSTYRRRDDGPGFDVESTRIADNGWSATFAVGMSAASIHEAIGDRLGRAGKHLERAGFGGWVIQRFNRSFLVAMLQEDATDGGGHTTVALGPVTEPVETVAQHLREIVHVPAWRGAPNRAYPTTVVDRALPGTFDRYVASVVAEWRARSDERYRRTEEDLAALGLASELGTRQLDETQVELLVGRLPGSHQDGADLVNIADVGFGVSQCLPVVVAMLAAMPGQLVYVEEPEIHLHPRAQVALAKLAVRAANRRGRVVLETHSALLLRGIQTAVANGEIAADQVALHWFKRSESGVTQVETAELASDGSFGAWPVDFDEIALAADRAYLDAS
jgi:AAA domain, putative AbiEii toxin, Type IV TA system